MKAQLCSSSDSERRKLVDLLPLAVPLSVYVQASNICNFRCAYCSQVLSARLLTDMQIERKLMSYALFGQIAEQLEQFDGHIKTINLTGFGEPLMNRDLSRMISLLKNNKLSHRVEVVSNGSLLTQECSDRIIESGLDLLRISVQGLTAEKYRKVSGVSIDINELIANIDYFYRNKKQTILYIKILDAALGCNQQDEFLKMFGNMCDRIAVEHLVPVMPRVDYSGMGSFNTGMVGYINENIKICPRPFYMVTVNTDGSVRPCCNYEPPLILGNIRETSIREMWEGELMKNFRLMMLQKTRSANGVCRHCQTPVYGLHPEDNLDDEAKALVSLYEVG